MGRNVLAAAPPVTWASRSTPSSCSSPYACGYIADWCISMMGHEKVNILLVDDQPAKLLAYEVILKELGEKLVAAASGREALAIHLKDEISVSFGKGCN